MTTTGPATGTARERTFRWADPMVTAAAARTSAGLDVLTMMRDGELPPPPIIAALGFDLQSVEPGRVVCAVDPAEYHYNPIGSVHGGVYATLLDSAAGCAVHSLLPVGAGYTSLDLTVQFRRAITAGTGGVRCVGTVTHLGGRTALAEARLVDGTDRMPATATSSLLLIRPEPG